MRESHLVERHARSQEYSHRDFTGRIRGEASAGFMQPSLNINISADLNPAAAGMKKCFLKARLMQSTRLEQVTGDAAFVGVSPADWRLELSGEIGLTRSSINLRKLHLEQPSLKGDVTGEGEVIFPECSPF